MRPEREPHPRLHPLIKKLFEVQKQKKIRTRDLAEKSGYSRKTLYDMKSGHHGPSIYTVINIGSALGLDLLWLEVEDGNGSEARRPGE